ncbi:MAG TPA: hypothetical protein VGN44_20735, partial [Candidatus Angelobacter sp.]
LQNEAVSDFPSRRERTRLAQRTRVKISFASTMVLPQHTRCGTISIFRFLKSSSHRNFFYKIQVFWKRGSTQVVENDFQSD